MTRLLAYRHFVAKREFRFMFQYWGSYATTYMHIVIVHMLLGHIMIMMNGLSCTWCNWQLACLQTRSCHTPQPLEDLHNISTTANRRKRQSMTNNITIHRLCICMKHIMCNCRCHAGSEVLHLQMLFIDMHVCNGNAGISSAATTTHCWGCSCELLP